MNKNGKERNHRRPKETRTVDWFVWVLDFIRTGAWHSWLWLRPPFPSHLLFRPLTPQVSVWDGGELGLEPPNLLALAVAAVCPYCVQR